MKATKQEKKRNQKEQQNNGRDVGKQMQEKAMKTKGKA
jgi:hypothetical protein